MASEQEIIELIEQIGIVPVVVLEDEKMQNHWQMH